MLKRLILLALCWMIAGCGASKPLSTTLVSPLSVLPTPLPSPFFFHLDEYSFLTTLTSPSGKITLPLKCTQASVDIPHCTATLPNGKTIYEADKAHWSPDERFAVICLGSFHDTPCGGYEVWDMQEGEKKDAFSAYYSAFAWEPGAAHTLVYFVQSVYLGKQDDLVAFNPLTDQKSYLDVCPAWFKRIPSGSCDSFPAKIIGGQISGLSGGDFRILLYQDAAPWALFRLQGNYPWYSNLRGNTGQVYTMTAFAEGYTVTPISYTVQISGTKAYVVTDGYVTSEEANHLDFHFSKYR
jgi:hypothetical protein